MNLRERTRELHHAAERHPIGAAMAAGDVDAQVWADWLGALLVVHTKLDPMLPPACGRVAALLEDLAGSPSARPNRAAQGYAEALADPVGAAYVFTGAHLMGGAVIEKRIAGRLPCAHLRWGDRQAALQAWRPLRECHEREDDARLAFQAVIDIMDEILHGT